MNRNKFLALAMAGAMTLTAVTPAFAEETLTSVNGTATASTTTTMTASLTIDAPTNTYTLTIPTSIELNSDGTAKKFTDFIKITNGTLVEGKKLTVTATSDWEMSADDVSTTIGYGLYANDGDEEKTTSWEFLKTEANDAAGATRTVYAKAVAADVEVAAAGTYSDTITFTAAVEDEVTDVSFTVGMGSEATYSYTVSAGTTWHAFIYGGKGGSQYANGRIMTESGTYVSESDVIVAGHYSYMGGSY